MGGLIRERRYGLDLLRGLSAWFIVGCHIGMFPRTAAAMGATHFCDMFVGVFACISGYFLARSLRGRERSSIDAILSRVRKILPVYLFWTLIFLGARMFFGSGLNDRLNSLEFWLKVIFHGGAACHLWYLADLMYVVVIFTILFGCFNMCKRFSFWLVASIALLALVRFDGNFYYYFIRMASFMAMGVAISFLNLESVKQHGKLAVLLVGLLFLGVCAHIMRVFPWYVCDYLVVFPLVVLFALPWFPRSVIGDFLMAHSFGLYCVHPLFTTGIGLVVVKKYMAAPYSLSQVVLAWVGWGAVSMVASVFLRRYLKHP